MRVVTGASYYGVFDLSDNLWKHPLEVGSLTDHSFQGTSYGNLDTNGDTNQFSWLSTSATAIGVRGGALGSMMPRSRTCVAVGVRRKSTVVAAKLAVGMAFAQSLLRRGLLLTLGGIPCRAQKYFSKLSAFILLPFASS